LYEKIVSVHDKDDELLVWLQRDAPELLQIDWCSIGVLAKNINAALTSLLL
jgi:hypothetical protein